jgi:hypothetical protein
MPFFSDTDRSSETLFSDRELQTLLDDQSERARHGVDTVNADQLLTTPTDDLVDFIVSHCLLNVPKLREDRIFQEPAVEIWRDVQDYGKTKQVRGFLYRIILPFDGHLGLFRHGPLFAVSLPPRAKAVDDTLIFALAGYDLTADDIKQELDKRISLINRYLTSQETMVTPFNTKLVSDTRTAIEMRKNSILNARNISAALGYPLHRRHNDPMTYIASGIRRKSPARVAAPAPGTSFVPEPALPEADYRHILGILGQMTVVMERSPSAFHRLEEEHLRDFYLVALNSHYEGSATGETFNANGKTDILIREKNKNIFIAECKYWRGEQSFTDAINQLLGYLSWRDTKACLMIFNRNQNLSAVLEKIKVATSAHQHMKSGPVVQSETQFRYVFGHPSDTAREIILTIMTFDVPTLPA